MASSHVSTAAAAWPDFGLWGAEQQIFLSQGALTGTRDKLHERLRG